MKAISEKLSYTLIILAAITYLVFANQEKSSRFILIDQHADSAPPELKTSFPDLVEYLIQPAKNDIEKVRVIFRWISQNISYDVDAFFNQRLIEEKSEIVLQRGKAVCGGYAQLFKQMCQQANIPCEIITGWSKEYSEKLPTQPNHAWNAVRIDNQWRLLDITWGSGYINDQQKYVREFQEHYFLTDPDLLIYDHLPEDARWQLIDKPISRQEFENLILLRPNYFNSGLGLNSHKDSYIESNGSLQVKIEAPAEISVNAELIKEKLVLADNYVFSQRHKNLYEINVHFPEDGSYVLRIYSRQGKETGLYHWALDYNVDITKNTNRSPFTKQYQTFYDLKCYLFSPLDFYLEANTTHEFKIQVENALEVALLFKDNTFLRLEQSNNIYSNKAYVKDGPVRVIAKTDTTNHFQFLLEYIVK